MPVFGTSRAYASPATSTSSASTALPGAAMAVTVQNIDATDSIYVRLGTAGDSATSSDLKLLPGIIHTFYFKQAGEHTYIHYIASANTPKLVILVDDTGAS